jgi:apolipoprotein N-acyltransferase
VNTSRTAIPSGYPSGIPFGLLPILTGLFIGTSYIPFPPWAILFGIAPVAVAWFTLATSKNKGLGSDLTIRQLCLRGFFIGWLAQFVMNAIGFHWIATTAIEFGHFPVAGGILVLIGFCAIAHAYYGVAGALTLYIFRKLELRGHQLSPISFVSLAFALFALCEYLWPAIFPWHLGYTWLWAGFAGAQFSDVIGFEGLNLVTLATNALFAIGWIQYRPLEKSFYLRVRPTLSWIAAGIALFFAINLLGLGRATEWSEGTEDLKILIAQGNIGNYEKLIVEKQKDFSIPIIATYMKLSAKGFDEHPEATHVLWPETAFPDYLDESFRGEANWLTVQQFAMIRKKTILTGAYSFDRAKKQTFNGFFAMSADGALMSPPYRKSILIPFGEKFPFSDVVPYMKWLFPGLGSFGQGDGPTVMDLGHLKVGPQICLESLYPTFSASMARQGAEIFSNVTNDSWFGRTFEPYQHMIMTLARAVENRRPLLRSTNTGITTVALANGTILEQSPIGQEWVGFYTVPFKKNPPIATYSRIAGYTPWMAALVAVLTVLGSIFRRRRS